MLRVGQKADGRPKSYPTNSVRYHFSVSIASVQFEVRPVEQIESFSANEGVIAAGVSFGLQRHSGADADDIIERIGNRTEHGTGFKLRKA